MTQFSIDLANGPSAHRPSQMMSPDRKLQGQAQAVFVRRAWPFLVNSRPEAAQPRQSEGYAPSAFAS